MKGRQSCQPTEQGALNQWGGALLHCSFRIALMYKQKGASSPEHARCCVLFLATCVHFKWPLPYLPVRLESLNCQACSVLIPDLLPLPSPPRPTCNSAGEKENGQVGSRAIFLGGTSAEPPTLWQAGLAHPYLSKLSLRFHLVLNGQNRL